MWNRSSIICWSILVLSYMVWGYLGVLEFVLKHGVFRSIALYTSFITYVVFCALAIRLCIYADDEV